MTARVKCTEVKGFVKGRRDLIEVEAFLPYKGQIKAVVFDIDGTLTDSIGQIVDCTKRTFDAYNLPYPQDEAIVGMIGKRLNEGIESILPPFIKDRFEEITQTYREIFQAHDEIKNAVLFPQVEELLASLKEQGYKIGYASGKSTVGVLRTLETTALGNFCDALCAGDEVPSKPNPLMMIEVARRLNLKPHEILGVGDAGMDIEMYHNASCVSCAVETGVWSGEAMEQLKPHLLVPKVSLIKNYLCA